MNPPGGFKGGKVFMTITEKQQGVTLYLTQNGKSLSPYLNKEVSVEDGQQFIITAVPTKNSFNTAFSFQYRTDGVKQPEAPIWAQLEEWRLSLTGWTSNIGWIIGLIVGIAVILLALLGIYCYKRCQLDKVMKHKANTLPEQDLTKAEEDPFTNAGQEKIKVN